MFLKQTFTRSFVKTILNKLIIVNYLSANKHIQIIIHNLLIDFIVRSFIFYLILC